MTGFVIGLRDTTKLAKLAHGDAVEHLLKQGRHAWLQVAEGEVGLNGQPLKAGDGAAVSDATSLKMIANRPSQVLLFDLD